MFKVIGIEINITLSSNLFQSSTNPCTELALKLLEASRAPRWWVSTTSLLTIFVFRLYLDIARSLGCRLLPCQQNPSAANHGNRQTTKPTAAHRTWAVISLSDMLESDRRSTFNTRSHWMEITSSFATMGYVAYTNRANLEYLSERHNP